VYFVADILKVLLVNLLAALNFVNVFLKNKKNVWAYSKRVPRTNCALRNKKCAPRISSGIYFLSTS